MTFWNDKFPGQIFDLNYESLTEHQEDETRKLLEHIGLNWEGQYLEGDDVGRLDLAGRHLGYLTFLFAIFCPCFSLCVPIEGPRFSMNDFAVALILTSVRYARLPSLR
jgi:hypothetical protein